MRSSSDDKTWSNTSNVVDYSTVEEGEQQVYGRRHGFYCGTVLPLAEKSVQKQYFY